MSVPGRKRTIILINLLINYLELRSVSGPPRETKIAKRTLTSLLNGGT
jgi:hypothetical protein